MDFEISEDQRSLRDAVREVLEAECPLSVARDVVETGRPAAQPWRSALELGWTGIAIAEELGGLGLSFEELGLVVEQHGRALAPGPFLATTTWFAPLVEECGEAGQRAHVLSGVAAGSLTGTLAAGGEPGCRARPEGAAWMLDGGWRFVLDGASADEIIVAARIERGDGVGLFLVPRQGLKSEPVVSLDASRPLAHLRLDGVRVDAERVLGTPGECAAALERALDTARVALALESVGTCQRLLEITLAHAKSRIQFDRPIGSFQAVQHKCADMFLAVEKARATAYFAMMVIAEDDPRRALAAAMAKAAAGDAQRLVCKEAIQIHGGVGFTWESDVHLLVKRAKTCDLLLGGAAEQRARIAELLEL